MLKGKNGKKEERKKVWGFIYPKVLVSHSLQFARGIYCSVDKSETLITVTCYEW